MIALRVARAVKGWRTSEAADILGISPGHLCNLEAGRHLPSAVLLAGMRGAYGDALTTAEKHYGKIETNERGGAQRKT